MYQLRTTMAAMAMGKMMDFGQRTDVGNKRDLNEDSLLADPALGLWLVADGMGGYQGGEIASKITVETIHHGLRQGHSLDQAIRNAHQSINEAAANGKGYQGMGSTVVALKVNGARYEVAWAGDSRAYLWSEQNRLQQITQDHSYISKLLEIGALRAEEARDHPSSHLLTSCLGPVDDSALTVGQLQGVFGKDDTILLCSDGLTDELLDEEIAVIFNNSYSAQQCADQLVATALDKGGRDNISVMVIPAAKYSWLATINRNPLTKNLLLTAAGILLAIIVLVLINMLISV